MMLFTVLPAQTLALLEHPTQHTRLVQMRNDSTIQLDEFAHIFALFPWQPRVFDMFVVMLV